MTVMACPVGFLAQAVHGSRSEEGFIDFIRALSATRAPPQCSHPFVKWFVCWQRLRIDMFANSMILIEGGRAF